MAGIKWIKLSVEMFDDEKIKLLESLPDGDTLIVIWCKLLTLAGKSNHGGYIMLTEQFPYTEEMLITIINRPSATVRLALSTFEKFGMVNFEESSSAFVISNWYNHQSVDGMEKIKEQQRLRKQKQREKEKQLKLEDKEKLLLEDNTSRDMSQDSPGTVTQCHKTDIELELERESNKDIVVQDTTGHQEIIDYLNLVAGKNFKSNSDATKRLINGRLKEGYKIEDFKAVIDIKCRQWKDKPDMQKYIRPATLFSPSKFEGYLNEAPKTQTHVAPSEVIDDDVLEARRQAKRKERGFL